MDFLNNKMDYVFRSTVGKKEERPKLYIGNRL